MRVEIKNGSRLKRNLCFVFLLTFVSCFLFFPSSGNAQKRVDDDRPKNLVPPALSILSKDEKKQLNATTKMKDRTKLALTFMDARLTRSETLTQDQKFALTLQQLGRFDAVLRDTMEFLGRNEGRKGSLKNLKRFEMSLRKFVPRLELIRRETPDRYGYHVKQLIISVRKARTKAIAPMFGDTVLPEGI